MQKLLAQFKQLNEREQKLAIISLIAVLILGFYWLIWSPLNVDLERNRQAVVNQKELLSWVEKNANRAIHLKQTGDAVGWSKPWIHSNGSSGSKVLPVTFGNLSTSITFSSALISLYFPNLTGKLIRSACHVSIASITPEASAASIDSPLPSDTATDREFGRVTMTVGNPIRSRPVRLATRVIPIARKCSLTAASVSSGVLVRCVSTK